MKKDKINISIVELFLQKEIQIMNGICFGN